MASAIDRFMGNLDCKREQIPDLGKQMCRKEVVALRPETRFYIWTGKRGLQEKTVDSMDTEAIYARGPVGTNSYLLKNYGHTWVAFTAVKEQQPLNVVIIPGKSDMANRDNVLWVLESSSSNNPKTSFHGFYERKDAERQILISAKTCAKICESDGPVDISISATSAILKTQNCVYQWKLYRKSVS